MTYTFEFQTFRYNIAEALDDSNSNSDTDTDTDDTDNDLCTLTIFMYFDGLYIVTDIGIGTK